MKIIDAYSFYKEKYREYVVLVKSGIFYEVYNDDISIIYSLFLSFKKFKDVFFTLFVIYYFW